MSQPELNDRVNHIVLELEETKQDFTSLGSSLELLSRIDLLTQRCLAFAKKYNAIRQHTSDPQEALALAQLLHMNPGYIPSQNIFPAPFPMDAQVQAALQEEEYAMRLFAPEVYGQLHPPMVPPQFQQAPDLAMILEQIPPEESHPPFPPPPQFQRQELGPALEHQHPPIHLPLPPHFYERHAHALAPEPFRTLPDFVFPQPAPPQEFQPLPAPMTALEMKVANMTTQEGELYFSPVSTSTSASTSTGTAYMPGPILSSSAGLSSNEMGVFAESLTQAVRSQMGAPSITPIPTTPSPTIFTTTPPLMPTPTGTPTSRPKRSREPSANNPSHDLRL